MGFIEAGRYALKEKAGPVLLWWATQGPTGTGGSQGGWPAGDVR